MIKQACEILCKAASELDKIGKYSEAERIEEMVKSLAERAGINLDLLCSAADYLDSQGLVEESKLFDELFVKLAEGNIIDLQSKKQEKIEEIKKEIKEKKRISMEKYSPIVREIEKIIIQCKDGLISIGEMKNVIKDLLERLPNMQGTNIEDFHNGFHYYE